MDVQLFAGIRRDEDEPGFKHFVLRPTPDPTGEMQWARGHYDSMYGRIQSAWHVEQDGVRYTFTVPANTSATLYLPAGALAEVVENGVPASEAKGVSFVGKEGDRAVYELVSGSYQFVVTN